MSRATTGRAVAYVSAALPRCVDAGSKIRVFCETETHVCPPVGFVRRKDSAGRHVLCPHMHD